MALWIKTPDGTLEKAAGAEGAFLPLTGGTLTGDLTVRGTVATINPGSEGAPAFASTLYPTTGMYGHADGVFFAVDGQWKFGAWDDHVGIRNDLQVGDSITAAGGTITGNLRVNGRTVASHGGDGGAVFTFAGYEDVGLYLHSGQARVAGINGSFYVTDNAEVNGSLKAGGDLIAGGPLTITRYHEALRLKGDLPGDDHGSYMAIYHGDTRAGYLGYPSAPSGGVTTLHADNNTLVLGSAVKVHAEADLQVDGKVMGTGDLQVDGRVTGLGAGDFQINQGLLNKTWADTALRLQSIDGGSDSNWNSIVGMSFHNKRQFLAMIFRQYEQDGELLAVTNGSGTAYRPIRVETCYMDSGEAAPRSAWVEDDVALDAAKTFLLTRHAPDPTVMDVVQLDDDDDGNPVYGSAPHDCATGNCVGTADHPCVRVRQQSQQRYSTHAGWSHAVTPEVIGTQDADGSAENPAPNGVDIGQMAALSLGASGSLARALEAVCWKFGTDLDEVLAEHRAHKLSTIDTEALGTIKTALEAKRI